MTFPTYKILGASVISFLMSLSCVKIQFQLRSNTEAKGIVFLNYAFMPFSSSSFYVLGLSIAAPQSFWDGLTQREICTKCEQNAD
jgi:hypothetical protein